MTPDERDAFDVVVGVLAIALCLGVCAASGWYVGKFSGRGRVAAYVLAALGTLVTGGTVWMMLQQVP